MTQGKDKNISSRSSRSLSRDGTDTGETKGSTGETICFVAAHSGGHMIPCATIASKLAPDSKILFITLDHKLERDILAKYNFINTIKYLELPKFPYQKVWLYPKFIYKLIQTVLKSREILRTAQVTRVITTGGISAIPVCFSAKILGIPIELYELNLEPGKTIMFLAPLANKIKICFAETKNFWRATEQAKCELVDYPVRFTAQDRDLPPISFDTLITQPDRLTIFILGGSQGSTYLNNLALQLAPLAKQIQVIHQTGANTNLAELKQFYAQHQIPAYLFTYTHEIAQLYNLADIIITRAGAGVLAEILFFNKPAIVIPLKTGTTSHQVANAQAFAKQYQIKSGEALCEAWTVLDQDQVTEKPELLLTEITKYMTAKAKRV
ncbi:MAG TPA: UDP-N-acetylglucosamine--N-acetylmuramyl-(pentapeptide) pyrophosphoryl-undecaprenol N-acetylglucosamine transferase [Candidatus Babeliales bacterium]|nr:UDP-N-acetylglucosamine--N-acetylmuramyl-(pentapeptide) pyrophosphoryl-undecaprenol N-acetylglucosamine transferase [Candidatus Babeliales bacterium]